MQPHVQCGVSGVSCVFRGDLEVLSKKRSNFIEIENHPSMKFLPVIQNPELAGAVALTRVGLQTLVPVQLAWLAFSEWRAWLTQMSAAFAHVLQAAKLLASWWSLAAHPAAKLVLWPLMPSQ